MIKGWYYLHTNGSLIYKAGSESAGDIRDSDFARAMWPFVQDDRETVWRILVEAGALGADPTRIAYLAKLWACTDEDAKVYASRIGVDLSMDGNAWCATGPSFVDLQVSPTGLGPTCLEALTSLCKELGFSGGKTGNATFEDLLHKEENGQFGVGA